MKGRKRKRGGDLVVKGKEGNTPVKEEKKEPKELEGMCAGLPSSLKSLRWPGSQLYQQKMEPTEDGAVGLESS